jgi:bacterioferritin
MKIRRLKSSPAGIAAGRPPARTRVFACVGRRPANGSHVAISIAAIFEGVAHGGQPPSRRMKIRRLKSSPAGIAAGRPPARTRVFACVGRRPANGSHVAISIAAIFEGGNETMKGNDKIIERLNALLADELTAVNQYIVHSEMCANWGYERLHGLIEKRAIEEMKHAERHIARLLFLEGRPIVSVLNKMMIGADVEAQLRNDLAAEQGAITAYNDAIRLAVECGDNGTREMLEGILKDEEAHLDWLEAQLDQIKQMGIQTYLNAQIG